MIVIAVGYRLAPENKFPAPLQDAYSAAMWALENADAIGGDTKRIGIGGENAGGNLAAAVTLLAREKGIHSIAFQALFYPILTCNLIEEAYEGSPDKHLLTYANMQWFCQQYLSRDEEKNDQLASPFLAANYENLPSALIITAGWDPLRIEAAQYAKSLKKAGVSVTHHCYEKVIHGFLGFPIYPDETSQAMDEIKSFVHNKDRKQS